MSNIIESASRFYRRIISSSEDLRDDQSRNNPLGPTTSNGHDEFLQNTAEFQQYADANIPVKFLGHSNLGKAHVTLNENNSPAASTPRGKFREPTNRNDQFTHSPGLFAVVSSDDEDSESTTSTDSSGPANPVSPNPKGLERAQAALPADFQDRIGLNSSKASQCSTDLSEDASEQGIAEDSEMLEDEDSKDTSEANRVRDREALREDSDRFSATPQHRPETAGYTPNAHSGIQWNEKGCSLAECVEILGAQKQLNSMAFMRTVCLRCECKCAFRRHSMFAVYALLDANLAQATWERPTTARPVSIYAPSALASRASVQAQRATELQASLLLFRQCRGWYEVLNEGNEAIPHWSTVEQLRRANSVTFLTRVDVRCLIAPSFVSGNPQAAESLAAAQPATLPAGTLFRYVRYLPNCQLRRGRKVKVMNLVLAYERHTSASVTTVGETGMAGEPAQYVYLGVEEPCKEAQFPARLCVSPVAGLDNISGVHSMAGILRKFRLPISVRPVAVAQDGCDGPRFPLMPDLDLTDSHLLRIKGSYRGDLLFVGSVDTPGGFFVITPAMLKDHVFHLGQTQSPMYLRLLAEHRTRTTRFIATGHKMQALSYLLRFLRDTTRTPRATLKQTATNQGPSVGIATGDMPTVEEAVQIAAQTGHDPRVGPDCELRPEEVDRIYEEIDDIYFYIRNGYYPVKQLVYKHRRPDASGGHAQLARHRQPQQHELVYQHRMSRAAPVPRALPNAEQLLANALDIGQTGGDNCDT